jgi:putative ABC transport system permease protein
MAIPCQQVPDVAAAAAPTHTIPRSDLPYSLKMLWRDRRRFLPALLAIGLSAVLIGVQCGLVLGMVRCTSALIDDCRAQIWVLPRDAPSLHQNYQLPLAWQSRLDVRPEVARSEPFRTAGGRWRPPGRGTTETCMVVGMRLDDESLGALSVLTPELRAALAEPGAVAIDAWEFPTLGLTGGPYEAGEVNGQEVRLAGRLHGFHGFSFAYVFCSQETFRQLVPAAAENPDAVSCLVARCHRPEDVGPVVAALRRDYPDMGVYASDELSLNVRYYWLFRSRGGAVLICTMALALLVGLAVTSETLYAAVLAQSEEFAVLDALGIPTRHVAGLVMAQALWLGVGGALLAVPLAVALARVALRFHTQVVLSAPILGVTFALTLGMAFAAGLFSLRPLRNLEPAKLLR